VPVRVRRLPPAAAFRAVLTHGQAFNLQDAAHKRQMLEHYLALAGQVPVWDVRFASGFDHFPALLDTIVETVG
jgi:hypothetical protein